MNSSAVAEIEKYQRDQQILAVTHKAFGHIPIDEKYLPVMNAYLRGHVAEAIEKQLMDLLHEVVQGNTSAIMEQITKNRAELSEAIREYSKLTDPWEREV